MFSVVIPAYNCEKTIRVALESVIKQTAILTVDEIIIINDGSRDQTEKEIQTFISEHSEVKIYYERQDNHGVSYTRNKAIKMAQGDWIALLDSDDAWKEDKLQKQYEILVMHPEVLFLGTQPNLNFGGKFLNGLCKIDAKQLCIRSVPITSSVVFERKTGLKLGLFSENMSYSEDTNFFQKFLLLDSFYVLNADLIYSARTDKIYGQTGLSSNLRAMHLGRQKNVKELNSLGLIRRPYMYFILIFNRLKYVRRSFLVKKNKHNMLH